MSNDLIFFLAFSKSENKILIIIQNKLESEAEAEAEA